MKFNAIILAVVLIIAGACAGIDIKEQNTKDLFVETAAIQLGWEMRKVELGPEVDYFYGQLAIGRISLNLSQKAQAYLRSVTHPVIANRITRLAGMLGYDLDAAGNIVGVQNLDMRLLKIAAEGFRTGYNLK